MMLLLMVAGDVVVDGSLMVSLLMVSLMVLLLMLLLMVS